MRTNRPSKSGYSLVELLVVLAVIASLAGALTVGWSHGAPTRAVEAAQAMIVQAVTVARGRAGVDGADRLLVVNVALDDREVYLRELGLVDPESAELVLRWPLPPGVIVVPPRTSDLSGISRDASWPLEVESSLLEAAAASPRSGWRTLARFRPDGRVVSGGGRLVVAAALRTDSGWSLRPASASCSVQLSRYGIATVEW